MENARDMPCGTVMGRTPPSDVPALRELQASLSKALGINGSVRPDG
jgi:hypothetical protein